MTKETSLFGRFQTLGATDQILEPVELWKEGDTIYCWFKTSPADLQSRPAEPGWEGHKGGETEAGDFGSRTTYWPLSKGKCGLAIWVHQSSVSDKTLLLSTDFKSCPLWLITETYLSTLILLQIKIAGNLNDSIFMTPFFTDTGERTVIIWCLGLGGK